ncbi:hypothetical protein BMETH_44412961794, partial [methanotrophic bacterial endosymbiont of Bathymodiolus sp.]
GSSGGASAAGELAITQLVELADQSAFNGAPASGSSEISAILKGLHAYIIKQITAKQAELEDPSNSAQNKLILAEIKVLLNTHNNLVAGLAKGLLYQG